VLRQASFLEFGFGDKGLFSALELVEMDGYALEEHFDLGAISSMRDFWASRRVGSEMSSKCCVDPRQHDSSYVQVDGCMLGEEGNSTSRVGLTLVDCSTLPAAESRARQNRGWKWKNRAVALRTAMRTHNQAMRKPYL
jgi:hypothetical protein